MLDEIPQLTVTLVVVLLVAIVGLGLSQQAVDTVTFEATDEFCATKDTVVDMIDSAFGWIPLLILAAIGGIALVYVANYMGYINLTGRQ